MDALYLDYATGALSEPARLLLDTHFTLRPEARAHARAWEQVGSALLDEPVAPMTVSAADLLAREERGFSPVRGGAAELPEPLATIVARRLKDLNWRPAAPGSREHIMPRWPQARIIEMVEPAPAGWTLGPELTLVLQGELQARDAVHRPGDVLVLEREADRPAPAGEGACLCFSVQDSGYSAAACARWSAIRG
jgi:putative transcriptional regulator